jgi:hypothetical protein
MDEMTTGVAEGQDDVGQYVDGQDAGGGHGSEAAKWRVKLRETEAERDQLRASLDGLRRQVIERYAGQRIAKPSLLWAGGAGFDGLIDEDGLLDHAKINARVDALVEEYGLSERPRPPAPDPSQGRVNQAPSDSGWVASMGAP